MGGLHLAGLHHASLHGPRGADTLGRERRAHQTLPLSGSCQARVGTFLHLRCADSRLICSQMCLWLSLEKDTLCLRVPENRISRYWKNRILFWVTKEKPTGPTSPFPSATDGPAGSINETQPWESLCLTTAGHGQQLETPWTSLQASGSNSHPHPQ